jgi:hypothetical protein
MMLLAGFTRIFISASSAINLYIKIVFISDRVFRMLCPWNPFNLEKFWRALISEYNGT